ncbi:5'-3' exoribonuclease 1-like isoform X2 [Mytilus trossulus]|uniref:5'-3' exoribonuclease 1-like isoform X2 n=1 Tax=Mytilus trossulus TaxID=6551 RepID=UPI003007EAEF
MGVPKFYRWISERYPCLSETVKELQIPEFDNLYLDMNGIIHTCSHPDDNNPHFRITLEKILADICHYIEFLFRIIKPKKVFFMAIDGVAPRAKMNQQRGRRFRSAREAEECEKRARESGEVLPTEKRFDSNCITPGTEFMVTLHEHLKYFAAQKVSTDPLWHGVRVYLSGHETPGEGEHKIMDFIRHDRTQPGYDHNTRHCLYGLDADLMMLGLSTHEPHFSLLREEVRFGGKKDNKRPATPEETTFHLLHLSLFREYLDFEFKDLKGKLPFGYDVEAIIDDWVLMGFLVGNDFIPNLPHLHIRHDALPLLWKTYMNILPECGGYLNEGGHLNVPRFAKYMEELKKFDIEKFTDMYTDLKWLEGKRQQNHTESTPVRLKPSVPVHNQFSAIGKEEVGDEALFGAGPGAHSEEQTNTAEEDEENVDTFDEEFLLHKRNYYQTKMEFETVTPEVLKDQAEGYVRAIQWILMYYYEGVPSWSWFYPHHYAPYISDITNFSDLVIDFDLGRPFFPFQQLMAVLPAASKDLLPAAYQPLMLNEDSPIIDFYPVNFQTDLNDKQQEWEAVVLIPFIEEVRLIRAMKDVENRLTDREKARNKHGPCILYEYTIEDQGPYQSSMPGVFPDLGVNFAHITEVYMEDFYVEKGMLIKGLLPECKLDVYYPGFPTMKHIPHTAFLKKCNVKVFQMCSKGENMMLQILGSDEDRVLEDVAKDYIDELVHVGWPHLYQAKVISVSDDENRFVSTDDGTKKVKGTPKMMKHTLNEEERGLWHREVDSITMRYHDRQGVDVGPTFFLVKALPVNGKKYVCGAHGTIILEKQFAFLPIPFVLQATCKDIAVHDPTYQAYSTLSELFPTKQSVFMMGSPHYGCQGEVLEVDEGESPRVRIHVSIPDEPDYNRIEAHPENFQQRYFPGYNLAQRLGINSHFLSRITGSIFIKKGSREESKDTRGDSVNIGLNLKFTKRNEEVPGYTRLAPNGWTYSEKAMETIGEYLRKFPDLWDTIIGQQDNKTDNFYEADIFSKNGVTLKDVTTYLKTLPCSSIKTMKTGADILDEGIIQAIEKEVNRVMEENRKKQKRVKMQVKPHLLFRPIPNESSIVPDQTVTFMLFDRVVSVRQGYTVPFGLRGTIVGIHKAEKEADTMFEVVFDEAFIGGIIIRCTGNKGYRVPKTAVVNISHGDRKYHGNTNRQKAAENFNKNAWRNDNSNNYKSGNYGDYNSGNSRNNSRGGYSGGNQDYNNRNQGRQLNNGHVNDNSYPRHGWQNQHPAKSTTDSANVTFNESNRPKMDIRQESFDESQKDAPLQFVTPKIPSPGRPQKTTQGQQQDSSRTMAAKMFQDSNNSEFADMWKELQKDSPSENTSLNQAAMALNKLPDDPALSPKIAPTSFNVQSLFDEASKSNAAELTSKLKDLSMFQDSKMEDGVLVCSLKKSDQDKEDGSAALKQMLNIASEESEKLPPTKEVPSYGRQVSIQELFDGVKQKSSSETVQSPSSNQFHQAQDQQYPPKTSHNQNQPNQYNNGGRQSGNQGRPKSGGMHQSNPNMNVSRNPVMQLLGFCKSIGVSDPKYEFNRTIQSGGYTCVINLSNGARFQGATTPTQEAAAESAASIALHQLGATFQPSTQCHPLMMMHQRIPPPGMMPHRMPQSPRSHQPQQPFPSAFRPVQPAGQMNVRGQGQHQNYHGGRGGNQGIYSWQQQQEHGRTRQHSDSLPSSVVCQPSEEQSPNKQSSQANPFIPLQVTKQQKTPQKKKHKDDNVNNNMSTPPKSVPETSPPQISKGEKQSHIPESSEQKTVHESGSRSKKTPPKQQTPNKRKSRLAANFSGM